MNTSKAHAEVLVAGLSLHEQVCQMFLVLEENPVDEKVVCDEVK